MRERLARFEMSCSASESDSSSDVECLIEPSTPPRHKPGRRVKLSSIPPEEKLCANMKDSELFCCVNSSWDVRQ